MDRGEVPEPPMPPADTPKPDDTRRKEVNHGQKIAQLVMIPVIPFRLCEEEEEDLYYENIVISDRSDGGFGSTDN